MRLAQYTKGALDPFPNGLESGCELQLITPFLRTHGSATPGFCVTAIGGLSAPAMSTMPPNIPRSMVTTIRYICRAAMGGQVHQVEIIDHHHQAHIAIVDVTQIRRSLMRADEANN